MRDRDTMAVDRLFQNLFSTTYMLPKRPQILTPFLYKMVPILPNFD